MTSILQTTHMQARYFSTGKMDSRNDTIPTFAAMMMCVQATQPVTIGDVPPTLYQEKTQSYNIGNRGGKYRNEPLETKTKQEPRPNTNYHPILQQKLSHLNNNNKVPKIRKMCQICNINQKELFPNKENLCIRSTLFGSCFSTCNRDHSKISDEEANNVINKLKKVIDNPELLKVNN